MKKIDGYKLFGYISSGFLIIVGLYLVLTSSRFAQTGFTAIGSGLAIQIGFIKPIWLRILLVIILLLIYLYVSLNLIPKEEFDATLLR